MAGRVLAGDLLDHEEAQYLTRVGGDDVYDLFYWANKIRIRFVGREVKFCAIVAAKVGGCSEDCKFCAQSEHYHTAVGEQSKLTDQQVLDSAWHAADVGADSFGIVNSGRGPTRAELEDQPELHPMECLKIISIARFLMPEKEIKVAGGREKVLRDVQSWIFFAGADSTMIGNYLTTYGRSPEMDHQMVRDLGLRWTAYFGGGVGRRGMQVWEMWRIRESIAFRFCMKEKWPRPPRRGDEMAVVEDF